MPFRLRFGRNAREVEATLQHLAAIVDSTDDAIIAETLDGIVETWNTAAENLYGYSASEMMGQSIGLLVPPERAGEDAELLKAVKAGATPEPLETTRVRKGGGLVRIWLRVVPVNSAAGEITGAVHLAREIQHKVDLEAVAAHLAAIVQYSRDAIISSDAAGRIQTWSTGAERMYGYTAEEAVSRPISLLLPPDRIARETGALEKLRQEEPQLYFESVHIRKSGERVPVEVTIAPIRDRTRSIVGVSHVVRDLTQIRALEDQLRESQKAEALGRLAGGIAHDFNNLLMIVTGYTESLLSHVGDISSVRDELEQIRSATERASALTRQLLIFSRRQAAPSTPLSVNWIIQNLEKMLGRVLGEDIELVISLAKDVGPVFVNPSQVEQVILNLVVNARDAMPHGGRLALETANVEIDASHGLRHSGVEPGPYVMLAVSDTGSGMDRATQDRIFEPFFTTKEAGRGTGLGLSIVAGIIKQAGGDIAVESEPGLGTTFRIYLPCVAAGTGNFRQ